MKYGILGDSHHDLQYLRRAINVLRNHNVDAVLIHGDILEPKKGLQATMNHSLMVLDELAALNSEIYLGPKNANIYIQPGSHEPVALFDYMLKLYSGKYPNIINSLDEKYIRNKDHDIVFLPGSDTVAGGQHLLGNDVKTDRYMVKGKKTVKLEKFESIEKYNEKKDKGQVYAVINKQNMNDLKKRVKDPDKTVIISHVPPRFESLDTAIDVTFFAEGKDGSIMPGTYVAKMLQDRYGSLNFAQMQKIVQAEGYTLKIENRGNEDLRDLYKKLGINKAVSGHFHESTHRANNWKNKHVKEDKWTTELFWNAGHLDEGHFGILDVKGNKVKYHNVKLKPK
jgi:Icc-related predicted phosphoesterase